MNSIYVIQNAEKYVVGATYENEKAYKICKDNDGWSYREVPFWSCEGTEIIVKAGPIPAEYFKQYK